MIFQRVNRSDPERVFMTVQANAALVADQCVQLELNSASVNGVLVRAIAAGNEYSFVGLADKAIASGAYGLVQVYGYRSTSIVFQTNTSIDTGNVLVPTAAVSYFATIATTVASNVTVTQQPIFGVLLQSIASSSASATISAKVFIRAL